jgi:hypothetical protein
VTAEEFEQGYADRSHVTVEWLHTHGQVVRPCECGWDDCEGWQMTTSELYDEEQREREYRA